MYCRGPHRPGEAHGPLQLAGKLAYTTFSGYAIETCGAGAIAHGAASPEERHVLPLFLADPGGLDGASNTRSARGPIEHVEHAGGTGGRESAAHQRRHAAQTAGQGAADHADRLHAGRLGGITKQELLEDPDKAQSLLEKAALEFQPDSIHGPMPSDPVPHLILGDRMTVWPGHGVSEHTQFQFVESEFMKDDEYDAFLDDPTDWVIRKYLPRAFSALERVRAPCPPSPVRLRQLLLGSMGRLASGALARFLQGLRAGRPGRGGRHRSGMMKNHERMVALGFPDGFITGPVITAPFDMHVGRPPGHARHHDRHHQPAGQTPRRSGEAHPRSSSSSPSTPAKPWASTGPSCRCTAGPTASCRSSSSRPSTGSS